MLGAPPDGSPEGDPGAAMAPSAAAKGGLRPSHAPGAQVACEFPTPGRAFACIRYLLYVPELESSRAAERFPVVLFLHGAGEVDKQRVLVRDPETRRRSMMEDGAWRLRTVPGMLPALADQRPLPFVLVMVLAGVINRFSNLVMCPEVGEIGASR